MARWLAQLTVAANQWGDSGARDSESAPRRRDSQRRQGRQLRPPPEQLPPVLGGHTVLFAGVQAHRKWVCGVCHRSSATRFPFAARRCPGSAVAAWARFARSATSGEVVGRGHTLMLTGPHVWCFDCGATACSRAVLLKKACPGAMRGAQCKWRMQARQRLLLGLHPEHRTPLHSDTVPEPGQPWPPGFSAAVAEARSSGTTVAARPKPTRRPRSSTAASVAQRQPAAQAPRLLPVLEAMRDRIRARAAAA